MKKQILLLISIFLFLPLLLIAQENKVTYKFGGVVEFKTFFDDYRSKTGRYELQYNYPLAPNLNASGVDINQSNSLHFSIFSSRLTFSVSGLQLLKADVSSYIETDFLGSTEAYNGMLNLRHAYINLKWKRNNLLIGQSNHLTYVDEVAAGVICFAAGYPFNTLNRGMQVKYSQNLAKNIDLSVAALIYASHKPVGPVNAQMQAGIPDLHAQLKFGDANKIFGGITFGYKFFKPRTVDAMKNLISTTFGAYDVNAFFKATTNKGYTFKLWGIYGENLTMYNMLGGYGKIFYQTDNTNPVLDYDYANSRTLSAWLDFETPAYKNFKFGFFYGYQKSYGTATRIDATKNSAGEYLNGFYRDPALEWFCRISPRVLYSLSKKLIFGVEYNLTYAQWAKTIDANLRPVDKYSVNHNNRLEFVAKFVF